MFNFARQGFANPFFSTMGASFQPGGGLCAGWHPNAVGLGSQIGGFAPPQYGVPVNQGFGLVNPIATQFATGMPTINPLVAQLLTNWQTSAHLSNPMIGRTVPYGIDPRLAGVVGGQQGYGYVDPNVAPFGINPAITGDPVALQQLSQQFSQVNPFLQQQLLQQQQQQQLPIRSLIGGQQGIGSQQFTPGFASPVAQWDPYRALIETQLISQLLTNPLQQLQRGYGQNPELAGFGTPFIGQAINPFVNPFYA